MRESDIFLALFHKKAGDFTIEEFNVASEEFKQHASPKVFTFCKDLQSEEKESVELVEFKKRLFEELGHYWCRYDTRESLQLQFVMQLQLVESIQMGELKVEGGNVTMDGICIAPMDKLKFAAANEDYQKMQTEMFELREETEGMQLDLEKKQQKLEKKKGKLEKDPDDEDVKASEFFIKAQKVFEKEFGIDHVDTAMLYRNIGYAFENVMNYRQALEYYSNALSVFSKNYDESHSDVSEMKERIDKMKQKI